MGYGEFPSIWLSNGRNELILSHRIYAWYYAKSKQKHTRATHMNGYWIYLRQQNGSLSTLWFMIWRKNEHISDERMWRKFRSSKNLLFSFGAPLPLDVPGRKKGKLKKCFAVEVCGTYDVLTPTLWSRNNSVPMMRMTMRM